MVNLENCAAWHHPAVAVEDESWCIFTLSVVDGLDEELLTTWSSWPTLDGRELKRASSEGTTRLDLSRSCEFVTSRLERGCEQHVAAQHFLTTERLRGVCRRL